MFTTIGLIVKNAPAILGAAVTLKPLMPKRWRGALNKVKTGAVVAGAITTAAAQPWEVDSGLRELLGVGMIAAGLPVEVALPAAPVLAVVATFFATSAATYITGWATREDAEKLWDVER